MTATRIYDCFLFNDEHELLEIRLELLSSIVDQFVVVTAGETFTGRKKQDIGPRTATALKRYGDRISRIHLPRLPGRGPWERETYSRNALAEGYRNAGLDDWIMVSDVDEIPNPDALLYLRQEPNLPQSVLVQNYFNFKFNYRLMSGLQAAWAGPVLTKMRRMTSPQEARSKRWMLANCASSAVWDGGWHFSYLTRTSDVSAKTSSYSHQEQETKCRTEVNVEKLIRDREGFHDHLHPGSVWAVVSLRDLNHERLSELVSSYPDLIASGEADAHAVVEFRTRRSVNQICMHERGKVLRMASAGELALELLARLRRRAGRF